MALSEQDIIDITRILGHPPTPVETHIFDAMWSEHCSYKSTKQILKTYLPTQGHQIMVGIGEDAGIINWTTHNGHTYGIAISHESHNHPSQLLPIEGAATGVGGVVRDVYCMGADVIGVLNSLHFGLSPDPHSHVGPIATQVVTGISDYANPLGVPVLGGETLYHPSYNDNCLVNVAALGLVRSDHICHSYVPKSASLIPHDIILVGKSTDATGFGGASFSSQTMSGDTQAIGAVQVHDPFIKRVTVEALRALLDDFHQRGIEIGFKDLGAGGIACATSEIAAAGGFGVTINLDAVNVAIPHLPPEVIACSETQERFCLAVPQSETATVLRTFNEQFNLGRFYPHAGAVKIGEVTTSPIYHVEWQKQVVASIPVNAITSDVSVTRPLTPRPTPTTTTPPTDYPTATHHQWLTQLMSLPNMRSKRFIYRHFDQSVRGQTVLHPGDGDAVIVAPLAGCQTGVVCSMDSNLYGELDPYTCGAYAVAEAIRNVVSVGGEPLAITDCLNYGSPENPTHFFDFVEGVKGIADAANGLRWNPSEPLPVISGNVSLYNESHQGQSVIPSPVIVVIGRINTIQQAVGLQVFAPHLSLIRVGAPYLEMGGTQWASLSKISPATPPQVRFEEESAANRAVHQLIQAGQIVACHDISGGGAIGAIIEMLIGSRGNPSVGATLTIQGDPIAALYSENGGYIVAVSNPDSVLNTLHNAHVPALLSGHTTTDHTLTINGLADPISIPLSDIVASYQPTLTAVISS